MHCSKLQDFRTSYLEVCGEDRLPACLRHLVITLLHSDMVFVM
jgi:hypothetical protein